MSLSEKKNIGDPSSFVQAFTKIHIKVLCCRYWLLNQWDCNDMVFPYWRIYWNKNSGGEIAFMDTIHEMDSKHLYIIPPFTPFNSRYALQHNFNQGIHVSGRHINKYDDEDRLMNTSLLHLFIHFNLGIPFDNVYSGIFKIELTEDNKEKLKIIAKDLKKDNQNFPLEFNFTVQSLIMDVLSHLGSELWETINIDDRVLKIIRYIETNINENFSNDLLASKVNMATNSFARLFKNEMKITLHAFINKRRIAKACDLFDHSTKTIEDVAFELGFSDRYHFSRVFKTVTSNTPANYRNSTLLKL